MERRAHKPREKRKFLNGAFAAAADVGGARSFRRIGEPDTCDVDWIGTRPIVSNQ